MMPAKMMNWFTHNVGLKAIALALAIATWFYVSNEISKNSAQNMPRATVLPDYGTMISRRLYVKALFIGEPPAGFELVMDEVAIDPPYLIVAGPKKLFMNRDRLETEPIDISRYKKTTVYNAPIASIAPSLDTDRLMVRVTIPVRKISEETPKGTP